MDEGAGGHWRVGALAAALTVVACLATALTGPVNAVEGSPSAERRLATGLNGAREVPGPGDRNGKGSVVIRTRKAVGKVCANASWRRIRNPQAAHIHRGRAGTAGDVVVDLSGSVTGGRNCARAPRPLIRRISNHPRRFYFNIHNRPFPDGAIRGQLHR